MTSNQLVLERLESSSIVPSRDVLALENCAAAELKYLLGNVLSADDVHHLETFSKYGRTSDIIDAPNAAFVERFSRFSLITPDADETRVSALRSIIYEEQRRSSLTIVRPKNISVSRFHADRKMWHAFRRVRRKLDELKRFCPSLYYCQDDIITVWGNLIESSQNIFHCKRHHSPLV